MNTTVTESLRGTLVPRTGRTMRNWRATPSLSPQLMPRQAAGRRQMNSRSVPAAARPGPAKRVSGSAECPAPCAVCRGRDLGAKGWPRKGRASIFKWVYLGEIPVGGRGGREDPRVGGNIHCSYHSLLSFGSQFHLKTQCCFFSSVPLWQKASGRISALFCQELLWAFFRKSEGKKRVITKKSCFGGEGRAAGAEVSLQLSEGGSTYFTSCKNLSHSSSHKALLCLAESAPNLERRKRNKYSKCWGSTEARVSYVGFIEKQNFLVKLSQFSMFLFWVFVFFKKGVSCAQRVC